MRIRSVLAPVYREVLSAFFRRTVPIGDHGPIVSFSFDDFPRSAFAVGGEILKRFGARGTYYAAMDLMDRTNDLGKQFHAEDLRLLVEDGHELASHTKSHLSSREVSFAVFQDNVQKGREKIAELMGFEDSGNFAYPYGHVTFLAKRKLGPELLSCRGTCRGINGPDVDLNLLRANSLYGDLSQLDHACDLISRNQREKGWLIFYTHDIGGQPSKFGCTPELFEAVVAHAVKAGKIMTIAAVMAQLGVVHDSRQLAGASCAQLI
jgi:peptidoglycan/xylan/chitin deacetylase (PgdA/CDA1 family)